MPRGPSEKELKKVRIYDPESREEHEFPTNPQEMGMVDEYRAGRLSEKAYTELRKLHGEYQKRRR